MSNKIEVMGPIPNWINLKGVSKEYHYTAYSEYKYESGKTKEEAIKKLNATLDKEHNNNI